MIVPLYHNMRRRKLKYFLCGCVLVTIYYFFGVGDYVFSKNFETEFNYPLNIDIRPVVKDILSGKKPDVAPINVYPYRYLTNSGKCNTLEKLDLFIVVKSAMKNFDHRMAIRQTYGQENALAGRIIKTLFFLGIDDEQKSKTQSSIYNEMAEFKDIIQMDFIDAYFNNTIKTMMSFRWVYEHCATADYYLFTDDDMYISVSNLLNYVQDIHDDQKYAKADNNKLPVSETSQTERDGHLYTGYVFKTAPQRFMSSKWRVSLEEYPWNKWPTYVTAGAYVVSNKSMKTLYVASLYVKHFRFDDIYLGIVAKKVGITPIHCPYMYFYKRKYSKEGYAKVIASHGYDDHDELIYIWNEQNTIL